MDRFTGRYTYKKIDIPTGIQAQSLSVLTDRQTIETLVFLDSILVNIFFKDRKD
jgi:hypothetical protein